MAHLRSNCVVLQIQLANEASALKIRSGNGTYYQLKLLEVKVPATEMPPEIDHFDEAAVADGNMAALKNCVYMYIYIYIDSCFI